MKTTTPARIAALAVASALTFGACSAGPEPTDTETPTLIVTETAAADPAEVPAPVTAESPVGTIVPTEQVEDLRAAGVQVYVPDRGGEPVIVESGEDLPDVVVAEVREAGTLPISMASNALARVNREIKEAGLSAFIIYPYIQDGPLTYTTYAVNVPGRREFWTSINGGASGHATKEAALAEVQPLIDANPGVPIVDAFEE